MKNLVIILCLFSLTSFGQNNAGTLSTTVNGSSVEIKIDSAWRNCGAHYDEQVFFYGQSMTWLQVDRGWAFGCGCLFNYSVTVDSLADGTYEVVVYYTNVLNTWVYDSIIGTWIHVGIPCDTTYLGTTFFTISNSVAHNPVKIDSSASPCLLTRIDDNLILESSPYPNPTSDIIHIPSLKNAGAIELKDMMGNPVELRPLKFDGKSVIIDVSSLLRGIYYLKYVGKIYKIIKI